MISYACKDLGVDCDWSASAETEEELWSKIRVHAIEAHNEKPYEYSAETKLWLKAHSNTPNLISYFNR